MGVNTPGSVTWKCTFLSVGSEGSSTSRPPDMKHHPRSAIYPAQKQIISKAQEQWPLGQRGTMRDAQHQTPPDPTTPPTLAAQAKLGNCSCTNPRQQELLRPLVLLLLADSVALGGVAVCAVDGERASPLSLVWQVGGSLPLGTGLSRCRGLAQVPGCL
ncbi:hypothetical protein CRENBAI_007279 [Crenichthys baileyi]|uniref:Uncharacterized protein n=1 Tax=Crenichthys baileyi TaxID=28760 RepID=A0AAV9QQB5_9TELE